MFLTISLLILWLVFNIAFVALRLRVIERRATPLSVTKDRHWRTDTYASKLAVVPRGVG